MNNMFGLDSIPPMRARRKQEVRNPVLSKRHSQCFVCVCARGRACVVRSFDVNAGRHPKIVLSRWGSLLVGADLWGRWSRCDDDGQASRAPRNDSPRFCCCCSAVRRVSLWRGQRGIVKVKKRKESSSRLGAKKKDVVWLLKWLADL